MGRYSRPKAGRELVASESKQAVFGSYVLSSCLLQGSDDEGVGYRGLKVHDSGLSRAAQIVSGCSVSIHSLELAFQ